ncbi:hypothetical protein KO561_07940 [Radiobacillus kanasensis]|uniref:hypothetical protein n=1 Tax=Radiobacillus kanasensis TaxID=2844358 RepID=UPI001E5BE9A4|nr:hypothetical protein [Radiobacillus kanasensis]UFU00851.1 hypothetical protein KO561_07940 [Radiobacillus kanasensis]
MIRKRIIIISIIVVGLITFIGISQITNAKLVEPVKVSKQVEDFVLHVRIEQNEKGFQVLRALEYKGEAEVEILHRTPLISISIDRNDHDFTGSPVSRKMDPGDKYARDPKYFEPLEEGTHTIFIHGQFYVNDELINIEEKREITFK